MVPQLMRITVSLSMFTLILKFDFDIVLGLFWLFWALMGYFWGSGSGSKFVMGSTHKGEELLFSMFPTILAFTVDLILKSFGYSGPTWAILGVGVKFKICFGV